MIVLTTELNHLLLSLAQRIDPGVKFWWSSIDINGNTLHGFLYRCVICNAEVGHFDNMIGHGIAHLKEKGLLVFI